MDFFFFQNFLSTFVTTFTLSKEIVSVLLVCKYIQSYQFTKIIENIKITLSKIIIQSFVQKEYQFFWQCFWSSKTNDFRSKNFYTIRTLLRIAWRFSIEIFILISGCLLKLNVNLFIMYILQVKLPTNFNVHLISIFIINFI